MGARLGGRSIFSLPHADDVVGGLSLIGRAFAAPVANTLDDLGVYRGIAQEKLFPAPTRVPRVRIQQRWRVPGVVSEDIIFESPHRPLEPRFRRRYEKEYASANHTVFARRVRPRGARGRPRLLYLHGYMQPETYAEELTLLAGMASYLNVEVIQPQPPYHGRRSPTAARLGGELYWTADLVRSIEAMRQHVLDTRALLSWLLHDDDRPVILMGLSLGGALTSILTCVEPRFALSFPLIAHMDLDALVADAPVMSGTRRDLRRFGWQRDDFAELVDDLGWGDLHPVLPPEKIHIFAASDDRFFDPDVVDRMWRDWGEPAIRWYDTSHMGFLPNIPDALARVREFADRAL